MSSVNETENERLRRALERLMDGQREAVEVLRQALDEDVPTENALGDLEDILVGASEDACTILGIDERSSGTLRTGAAGTTNVTGFRGKTSAGEKKRSAAPRSCRNPGAATIRARKRRGRIGPSEPR